MQRDRCWYASATMAALGVLRREAERPPWLEVLLSIGAGFGGDVFFFAAKVEQLGDAAVAHEEPLGAVGGGDDGLLARRPGDGVAQPVAGADAQVDPAAAQVAGDQILDPPPPGAVPSCEEAGVLGVLPGIVGSIQAAEALKLILDRGRSLSGRLLRLDAREMRFREIEVRRDPECPACGDDPSVTELIDYEEFCGVAGTGTVARAAGSSASPESAVSCPAGSWGARRRVRVVPIPSRLASASAERRIASWAASTDSRRKRSSSSASGRSRASAPGPCSPSRTPSSGWSIRPRNAVLGSDPPYVRGSCDLDARHAEG